ncbi:MAG: D-tyrosyl-tRNA(Tyr) deacylase [Eubacterium sp.]|nr:D-tyrosyl-tRNA(Tyr) deacylase [Eubacterium sp.]
MKFLIQRVKNASVTIDEKVVGSIDKGFFVLIGVNENDTREVADKMIRKLMGLRIFADAEGKTNLSISDVGGSLLLVSQFTLYADCKKGNRPSFIKSGSLQHAEEIYDYVVESCRKLTEGTDIKVETGSFGADMTCSIVNDGPFTIDLDSDEL